MLGYLTISLLCHIEIKYYLREIEVISDGEREGHGEEDNLASYAAASLKEVVRCAGLTHIDNVLRPILT